MTTNYPGPYGLRIFYTVNERDHKQEMNIDLDAAPTPGDDFATMDVVVKDGSLPTLETYVDTYVGLLQPFINSTNGAFTTAELWSYAPLSFDATFVSAYDISLPGTNATGVVGASEAIYTFRTLEGGIMRIHIEDTSASPGASVAYPALGSSSKNLVDFVLGDGGGFLGRDTSRPVSFRKFHPGSNERNFKKQYRS